MEPAAGAAGRLCRAPMHARSSKLAAKMWSWSVENLSLATQIDRYLAKLIFVPLMATLVLAAMLLLLEKMLRLFDFVVSEGGPVNAVWRMLANTIPQYLGHAIPLGVLLGWILGYWLGRYNTQVYAEFYRFPFLLFQPGAKPFAIAAVASTP